MKWTEDQLRKRERKEKEDRIKREIVIVFNNKGVSITIKEPLYIEPKLGLIRETRVSSIKETKSIVLQPQ